jgi:hypothetical protein
VNDRFLVGNLTALHHARSPVSLARLQGVEDGELVVDDDAVVDVQLRGPAGPVRLDPGVRPMEAAAQSLPPTALQASLVVMAGAGVGYAIEALIARGYAGRIVVLEPSPVSCLAALSRRDWTSLIAADRLRWLVGPDYAGWLDTWSWVTPGHTPAVVIHPVLGRLRTQDVRHALETLKKMVFNASANERARLQFAGPYLRHTLTNLPHLLASRDAGTLFGRFRRAPVAVLAAGPSLDRNLEELRPVRERALVIAVDTALRPCLAAGLAPDLVVGVDPGERNLRHLAVGSTPERTHLVAEPSLAPGSFDAFDGRVFTFAVGDHDPWPWLRAQGVDRAQLRAWGSVLASTLDLAVQIGGDPIVLLGADFAYTGGQPYCRNTTYEEDWTRGQREGYPLDVIWREWIRGAIETTDMHGRQVPTTPHLIAFRDWVADYCRTQSRTTIVNGTGAGLLESVPQVHVAALLDGREPVDRSPLTATDRGGSALPSMAWWDGRTPPEPWTSWAARAGEPLEDVIASARDLLPPYVTTALDRYATLRRQQEATTDERPLIAAYWRQVSEGTPSEQIDAARRLIAAPIARTSEGFYSAVCVLLKHGDVDWARAQLEEALQADFDGSYRLLLPLCAHACERTRDVKAAHLLYGVCDRLGLLSGRNAWALERAHQSIASRALHQVRHIREGRDDAGIAARALYEDFLASSESKDGANIDASIRGALRLPDFIVAGSAHSGSSLLYDFIASSPDVWARRPTEIHYFSRLIAYGLPFYARFFEGCPTDLRCGEASPSYLDVSSPGYPVHLRRDTAALIAAACPTTRVLVILRDPAARAMSLYAEGTGADLAAGADTGARTIEDASLDDLQSYRHGAGLVSGHFVASLRSFAARLGPERLLVLTTQDLARPVELARRLGGFLDVAPPAASTLPQFDWHREQARAPRLHQALREYYADSLSSLQHEFGVSL